MAIDTMVYPNGGVNLQLRNVADPTITIAMGDGSNANAYGNLETTHQSAPTYSSSDYAPISYNPQFSPSYDNMSQNSLFNGNDANPIMQLFQELLSQLMSNFGNMFGNPGHMGGANNNYDGYNQYPMQQHAYPSQQHSYPSQQHSYPSQPTTYQAPTNNGFDIPVRDHSKSTSTQSGDFHPRSYVNGYVDGYQDGSEDTYQKMSNGAQPAPTQPTNGGNYLNPEDQAAVDYIKQKETDGKWLAKHSEVDKEEDEDTDGKTYTFNEGPLVGYTGRSNGKEGPVEIYNPAGERITTYEGKKGGKVASPVAFDLNQDNRIGTTGETTAKDRANGTQLGRTIDFDMNGDGTLQQVEWMTGEDGLLFDTAAVGQDGNINGNALFGDQGGMFENGYEKLAQKDKNQDGVLRDAELDGLAVWQDKNSDGKLDEGERVELRDIGINEIDVNHRNEQNERGENLMRAEARGDNGKAMMTEDVWFGEA